MAAHTNGPTAIRYPRGNSELDDVSDTPEKMELGRGRKMREGTRLAVLSLGTVLPDVIEAARDIDGVAVYDMIFAKPLDENILAEVAALGCPVLTVEDGAASGGMGSAVSDWLTARGHNVRVEHLGMPDDFVTHGTPAQLKEICGYDAAGIRSAINNLLES